MEDISKGSSSGKPRVISAVSYSSLRAGISPWAYLPL